VGHYGYFRRINSQHWSLASRFIAAAGAQAVRRTGLSEIGAP